MRSSDKNFSGKTNKRSVVGRRSFLTATGSGALAATAGCLGGSGGNSDGVKIGGLFPTKTPGGAGMKQATEVLVNNLNEDGGLLGEDVELVSRNTEFDPATARDAYRELILEENVDVTTGIYSTEVGMAIFDEIPEFETLHFHGGVAPSSPMSEYGYDQYKYWFRTLRGNYLGRAMAEYVRAHFQELGITEAAIAAEDITGFDLILEGFLDNLPDFININFDQRFSSDTTDFSPILDQGEEDGIQMLFGFISQGGSALMTQWAQRKPNYMFGGADIFSSNPNRWENTSGAVEYVWSYVGGAAPGLGVTETTSQFIEDHKAMFDGAVPPHAQSYSQYDAILTWAESVKQAETMNEDEVISTVEGSSLEGTIGTLDWYGQDGKYPHTPKFGTEYFFPPIIQWQEVDGEGKQVGLYPDDIRSSQLQVPPWVTI